MQVVLNQLTLIAFVLLLISVPIVALGIAVRARIPDMVGLKSSGDSKLLLVCGFILLATALILLGVLAQIPYTPSE